MESHETRQLLAAAVDETPLADQPDSGLAMAAEWQNPVNPADVNGDGLVSPLDALLIINHLNSADSRQLPTRGPDDAPRFLDTNGDALVTPLDALLVINRINRVREPLFPTGEVTYKSFQGETVTLTHYEGRNVAFLVTRDDLDPDVMGKIVAALDNAYDFYRHATGREPAPLERTTVNGRATIAVVDKTCGAGCGYLGFTGIELLPTYFDKLYDGVRLNDEYSHVPFYELGRNFWFYRNQLGYQSPDNSSSIVTGFAVLMELASMDAAGVQGSSFRGRPFAEFRQAVEGMVDVYLADTSWDWDNTLRIDRGPPNPMGLGGADLFASFVFRLQREFGREDFLRDLWHATASRPRAVTTQQAVDNFVVAASVAAKVDLADWFEERRWPVSDAVRTELSAMDWPRKD